jgi:tRNA wybutosine-synthesizing protein 3
MDKSPQGFYDQDIIHLLDIINSNPSLETTSSCSGRITLMSGDKKGQAKWVYKTHTIASSEQVYQTLQQHQSKIKFLFEPLIIHIKCKDLETISKLLKELHKEGFKKSCIISTKNHILEVNDTGKMETILRRDLINLDYLKLEKLFSN